MFLLCISKPDPASNPVDRSSYDMPDCYATLPRGSWVRRKWYSLPRCYYVEIRSWPALHKPVPYSKTPRRLRTVPGCNRPSAPGRQYVVDAGFLFLVTVSSAALLVSFGHCPLALPPSVLSLGPVDWFVWFPPSNAAASPPQCRVFLEGPARKKRGAGGVTCSLSVAWTCQSGDQIESGEENVLRPIDSSHRSTTVRTLAI